MVLLKKFNVLEFDKYNRAFNPRTHIIVYYLEMKEVTYDDKLLIHFFSQKSDKGCAKVVYALK